MADCIRIGGRVAAPQRMEFSLSRHSDEAMTRAHHLSDLEPEGALYLCCDAFQRGVGTASCGTDTLERYRVAPGRYRLELLLRPLRPGDDANEVAAKLLCGRG